jgi:hypothetical protein
VGEGGEGGGGAVFVRGKGVLVASAVIMKVLICPVWVTTLPLGRPPACCGPQVPP